MSIGQELEELKTQIKLIIQQQIQILETVQQLQQKIEKIETTLEMVS